jgi:hypothetical protein
MKYYAYARLDGTIVQAGHTTETSYDAIHASLPAGLKLVDLDGPVVDGPSFISRHYYDIATTAIRPKALMTPLVGATEIAADGRAEAVISGLPDPCMVQIRGPANMAPQTVSGGSITITSEDRGRITVIVTAEPGWLPWSTDINAV